MRLQIFNRTCNNQTLDKNVQKSLLRENWKSYPSEVNGRDLRSSKETLQHRMQAGLYTKGQAYIQLRKGTFRALNRP